MTRRGRHGVTERDRERETLAHRRNEVRTWPLRARAWRRIVLALPYIGSGTAVAGARWAAELPGVWFPVVSVLALATGGGLLTLASREYKKLGEPPRG